MEIRVVYKKPKEDAVVVKIDNTFDEIKKLVNGYVISAGLSGKTYSVFCDEEGIPRQLPYCCTIAGQIFVGPVVFTRYKTNSSKYANLTNKEIKDIMAELN